MQQPISTATRLSQGVIDNKWNTHDYTFFPTGKAVAGEDANGDPIYRNLYTVVANGGPITLTDKDADTVKFLNDNLAAGDQKIQIGQKFDNLSQFNALYQRASNNYTALEAKKKAFVQNGLVDQEEADRISASQASPAILEALGQTHGDIGQAYDAIVQKANKDPQFAKQAGNIINDFRTYMGVDKEGKSEFDKILEKRQEAGDNANKALNEYENNPDKMSGDNSDAAIAAADEHLKDPRVPQAIKDKWAAVRREAVQTRTMTEQDKKNLKKAADSDYSGSNNLTGEAYLNSIPDPGARNLVREIGVGQMPIVNLAYFISKNPKAAESVAQAYPDFNGSKAIAYPKVVEEYSMKGKTGKNLNAGATALKHLYELKQINDSNPIDSRIPGRPAYAAYQNKVNTVASELAGFYGESNLGTIDNYKKTLDSEVSRDSAILNQAQSMGDKFDSYQQSWDESAPSNAYRRPMPQVDDAAKRARAALDPRYTFAGGSSEITPQSSTAVPAAAPKPTAAQVSVGTVKKFPNGNVGVWDGKGWAHQAPQQVNQ